MKSNARFSYTFPTIFVLALALVLLNIFVFYIGFMASDDSMYNSAAARVAAGEITLPERHWAFRYTVIYPLAALIATAGNSEQTTLYLTIGYLATLLGLTIWLVHRCAGASSALWFALLAGTTPILITLSSTLNADIPEALFLLGSVATFYVAWYHRRESNGLFVLAGVAAGLAMLTRETAYGIGLFYGVYFLRYGLTNLRPFIFLGLGTFAVLAIEATCYVAAGESPLYRLITASQSHGGLGNIGASFSAGSGNISNSRLWAPPLSLLLNQEFGLLFWLGIGCAIALRGHQGVNDETRRLLRYVYGAALVYFVWLGYSGAIRPLPRYFIFDVVLILMPIAVFVSVTPRKWLKVLILGAAIGANYAGLSIDNINQRFPERTIAKFVLKTDASVASDSEAVSRGRSFITLMGGDPNRLLEVPTGESAPASYFAAVDGRYETDAELVAILNKAEKIETATPPKLMVGRILDITGLARFLSANKYWWLAVRTPSVTFYRLSQ